MINLLIVCKACSNRLYYDHVGKATKVNLGEIQKLLGS